jgi:hypothetical protein
MTLTGGTFVHENVALIETPAFLFVFPFSFAFDVMGCIINGDQHTRREAQLKWHLPVQNEFLSH